MVKPSFRYDFSFGVSPSTNLNCNSLKPPRVQLSSISRMLMASMSLVRASCPLNLALISCSLRVTSTHLSTANSSLTSRGCSRPPLWSSLEIISRRSSSSRNVSRKYPRSSSWIIWQSLATFISDVMSLFVEPSLVCNWLDTLYWNTNTDYAF